MNRVNVQRVYRVFKLFKRVNVQPPCLIKSLYTRLKSACIQTQGVYIQGCLSCIHGWEVRHAN